MAYFTSIQESLFICSAIPSEEKEKLNKFLEFLEESGVGEIIEASIKSNEKGGRPGYNEYRLFASIIFAFSINSGSVRKIEECFKFDTRFLYLMEGKIPHYSTISRFCNNVVVARQREIYACIIKTIVKKFNIDISDVFVDGTKLEANANKYKFIYKPVNYHKRLQEGIRNVLIKYFDLPPSKVSFISKETANYTTQLEEIIHAKGFELVHGKGHKQQPIVKDYFLLTKLFLKLLEYEEQEAICGPNRNSYYKTDPSATAMCLKSDYYSGLGSNMHAAYTLEIMVSKGFILDYYVCQDRTDYKTLIPFLEIFYSDYNFYPINLCGDSGYGSLDNYRYIKEHNIGNYLKHPYWEKMISGEYIDLYHFDEEKNLICLNNKKAIIQDKIRHRREKETRLYVIEDCRRCRYKEYCRKFTSSPQSQSRIFEVCYDLVKFREEANKNLLSPKGIEMRVNRSSQVEGAFGVIKQDMEYDRVRRRGLENVSGEIMLVCLGYVIRKLFKLFDGSIKMDYWKAPEGLVAEEPKQITMAKLMKKRRKGLNEKLRSSTKKKSCHKT